MVLLLCTCSEETSHLADVGTRARSTQQGNFKTLSVVFPFLLAALITQQK